MTSLIWEKENFYNFGKLEGGAGEKEGAIIYAYLNNRQPFPDFVRSNMGHHGYVDLFNRQPIYILKIF